MCSDGWDIDDAEVTCRQLQFNTFGNIKTLNKHDNTLLSLLPQGATPSFTFGEGTGAIAMARVECTSSESLLTDCPYNDANNIGTCTHSEDAGVMCLPRKQEEILF